MTTPPRIPVDSPTTPSRRTADPRHERRRASRSLWEACEALLSAAEPRALNRALDQLIKAFECEGVALHAVGTGGELEPWCARGNWRGEPGDLRACLTIPLRRGGEPVGSLDLRLPAGQTWTPEKLSLIRTAAGTLGAALGARIELRRLRHEPGRDSVTGLPDARGFHSRLNSELDRARRHGLPLGVVMVDLDRFSAINSRYGRPSGDHTLQEVALVLRLALRESDTLARLGSDRFAVILPEADLGPARHCAERLRTAIDSHRFERVGRVSASIGVASCPRSGVDTLELLDSAERAVAGAKKAGRHRVASAEPPRVH